MRKDDEVRLCRAVDADAFERRETNSATDASNIKTQRLEEG